MARRLRIQFEGAMYHVINRGNYRTDVFGSVGAAQAFDVALSETALAFGWRVHGYVIMRNHFHLALETPQANLVTGMHRLQSAYATRFNRYRSEQGHVFQGRYQSLLIEDDAALARVVNYIHRNPVRAGLVAAEQAGKFRWSSVAAFTRSPRPAWLECSRWLRQLGHTDSAEGWRAYIASIAEQMPSSRDDDERTFCCGWAIGTAAWREAIARDHAHLSLHQGIAYDEVRELQEARWTQVLLRLIREAGYSEADCSRYAKGARWKREIATRLRKETGAAHGWIAKTLNMGSPHSVRAYVSENAKRD